MPYSCALAVCATFCAHISGALIPIFGPNFPSKCIPTSHQSYGTMVIEPSIIASATAEAESFRQQYSTASPSSTAIKLGSTSPRELLRDTEHLGLHASADHSYRLRLKRTFTNASMYTTDAENSVTSMSSTDRYSYSPVTPTSSYNGHGWTPDNFHSSPKSNIHPKPTSKHPDQRTALPSFQTSHPTTHSFIRGAPRDSAHVPKHPYRHRPTLSYGASPWLSAIPRSVASTAQSSSIADTGKAPLASSLDTSFPKMRRSMRRDRDIMDTGRVFDTEIDREYDGEDDGEESPSSSGQSGHSGQSEGSEGMEKKAAWLLMNLSVRDGAWASGNPAKTAVIRNDNLATRNASSGAHDRLRGEKFRPELTVEVPFDFAPRAKRRRATSL